MNANVPQTNLLDLQGSASQPGPSGLDMQLPHGEDIFLVFVADSNVGQTNPLREGIVHPTNRE
jgi:hypothetical protein